MVETHVVEAACRLLEDRSRRILITGGTGFIGGRTAWLLAEAGQHVTIAGRNPYRLGGLKHPRVQFERVDLNSDVDLHRLCEGKEVVIHAAALASTWGKREDFWRTNVTSTQNVVRSCLSAQVHRLVHVSSTAIHFEFRDRLQVADDAPLPARFACDYAESKAAGEQTVQASVRSGLNAVILRARAVFGVGDNSLLPRLVTAAAGGGLPQIGLGKNVLDLTYVDNVAYAIACAIIRGNPGDVCTITNEDPVELWPTLKQLFAELGLPPIRRSVSYPNAMRIAKTLCAVQRRWKPNVEPKLTPYSVGLLATSQTFSPAAARRVLDYRPLVSVQDGIRLTTARMRATHLQPAKSPIELELITTGFTFQKERWADRSLTHRKIRYHSLVGIIRHPTRGVILFDTGYSPRYSAATRHFPASVYGRLCPATTSDSLAVVSQLAMRGIAATDVTAIITSHFHADHISGHEDFPCADLIATREAWDHAASLRGIHAIRRGIIPSLLPKSAPGRLCLLEHFHDPGFGPFTATHDLLGDGTIRLVRLPGHARGQMGALLSDDGNRRDFLVADAVWMRSSILCQTLPHPLTYSFIDSANELRSTLQKLIRLRESNPEINIIPTHCPEIAAGNHFDDAIAQHLS